MNLYSISGFKPEANSKINIEAVLPNGQILKSKSITYFLSADFIDANSFQFPVPSSDYSGSLKFRWDRLDMRNKIENIYFGPELVIKYFKMENGKPIPYEKKVPCFYRGGSIENYPQYQLLIKDITEFYYDTLAVRKTLEELSVGDASKGNYIIDKAVFKLFAVDKDLATYYTSQKTFYEEYTVRVVQPNFSNITGGFGIFGTLSVSQINISIKQKYIESFGYRAY